jgi:hypothetical protein
MVLVRRPGANPAAFVAVRNRIFGMPADSLKLMGSESRDLTIKIKAVVAALFVLPGGDI